MDIIDWGTAQRVGEMLAGTPPRSGIRAESVQPLAQDFARRVSDYTGLALPAELPALEAVDRPRWIAANLATMRPLLEQMAGRLEGGSSSSSSSPRLSSKARQGWALGLPEAMRVASGMVLGVQVGALTGMLSQRVLGQYDLAILDPSVTPRLLLVAPNLAQAARSLDVDEQELVAWVTIHEVTHAVQFSGAPWLRGHLAGLLSELIEGLETNVSLGQLFKLADPSNTRELIERVRRGEVLRLTVGEKRWKLVEQMQATMTLVEGHAEHVMDEIGAELLPSLPRLRAAMTRRRASRGLPWRVLERLLGLELKLRQYEGGRRFCDAVVAAGGPPALARAWSSPETLPTTAELDSPELWLTRMA
ncbi:MAG TPA: zinc-dependent metalloprotease [Solirubrobacteraceae bacterium]|nr:zinc-dependent metalloprotease [Solirubrobacteraceae bacterium]